MFVMIFLLLFFILGISLGPLLLLVLIRGLGEQRSRGLAVWAISVGMKSVYRPAITFNPSDELTLKRRAYDEKHNAEYVSFGSLMGGVRRYLTNPKDRFYAFYGTPFGFVDELFGVVVDPRDVVVGHELEREQDNAQYEYRTERNGKLYEAVKAVFEVPRGRVGVRLSDAHALVGGSFDSQVVDKIRDHYETSQTPRADTTALRQLLVPLGAFVGIILVGFFISGQTSTGGGGGGGPTSTVGVGSVLFLLVSVGGVRSINWRDGLVVSLVVGAFLLLAAVLTLVFSVPVSLLGISLPLGLWAALFLALGVEVPPFVAFLMGRSLGPIGMALGKLFIIIGFLGFDRPVIDFDGKEYRVVEYADYQWPIEPKWYRFAMSRVGISFDNVEANWPDGTTLSRAKVAAMSDEGYPSDAPTGHVATDLIAVEDIYGFVPATPDPDDVFVRTDRTTGWLFEGGQDRRLMTAALQSAKQDFGGGRKPVGDKWILGATIVMAAMAMVFNVVVFF